MRKKVFQQKRMLVYAMVCLAVVTTAWASPASLPETVVQAHTIYIENETGFTELEYTTVLELNKWGRFELAGSREKADLILRLDGGTHVRALPDGQTPGGTDGAGAEAPVPSGYTRVALLEPKTGKLLWSDAHRTEGGKVKSGHLLDGLREAFRDYEKRKR